MPAGMQCWDAQGRLILDTNDRICRVMGYYDFPGGTGAVVTVNLDPNGTPFYAVIANDSSSPIAPGVSFINNNSQMQLSVPVFGTGAPAYNAIACRILYGTY